ncbi:MAG: NADH-quinone oxidoreductase subunit NuoG [Anaerolineae bacterium]|nr:NADH-quinone oxidoreductase subunit NuoG [Anaerolineae bacterium]
MTKTVTITIDDKPYEVPAGSNLVDVAKFHADNDIPVFCYHPKMAPVGMCRMCLVEMGSIEKDRATGEVLLDEAGKPKVRWMPKLQTACTQLVADGMVIRTATPEVKVARENVVEFLLTSHPLDCPICDKGGECPLQNLTMEHGKGGSRMAYEDKQHLEKHVPLGTPDSALVYLDEERCIQCARCVRFQDEVVGDDVLAFHERGRRLQIITNSAPHGFDTYFSGNTTDICPVGALTTADFRFGARPWELTEIPSIDPFDAAGSNISLSTRLDRDFGGRAMIKRVMPRQNEEVNEIWISDKVRFGHHFTRSDQRLQKAMVRTGGKLSETTWAEALKVAAEKIKAAGNKVAAIAGSGMSNEDLFALKQLVNAAGGKHLGAWPITHTGAELLAQVGLSKGSNLGALGKGDAVLIIASDLEEEVPMWRLRLKRAHDRGALVVVANARKTRMDDFADAAPRYEAGKAAHWLHDLKKNHADLAQKLAGAQNLVIVTGAEGLTLDGHRALMQAAANFLIESHHVGKANNGLLSTLPGANGMGLHYFGFSPEQTLLIAKSAPKVLIVAQAELLADDPTAEAWLSKVETVISLNLFPDALTQRYAQVALPIQSFAERDGTFTNGERRVQRFYTAQGPMGEALPAWQAIGRLTEAAGLGKAKLSAAAVMLEISQTVPAFSGMTYKAISKVEKQFPDVGGNDQYYGGTAYQNKGGLGLVIPTVADKGEKVAIAMPELPQAPKPSAGEFVVIPATRLYNNESVFKPSLLVQPRVMAPYAEINSADAKKLGIEQGAVVEIKAGGTTVRVKAHVNGGAPEGSIVLPRHLTAEAVPVAITTGTVSKV